MTDPRPEVSVIIPVFNGATTLPLQLRALAEQRDPPRFEVVVVDNRSTDGTATIAESEGGELGLNIRVVPASEYQGASYARNVGAAHARASFLMFCDADDVVSAHWVNYGRRSFDAADFWNGEAALQSDDTFDGNDLHKIRAALGDDRPFESPKLYGVDTVFPVMSGGAFGITKAAYVALGGFDQSFPSSYEDNDFAFRARRAGIEIYEAATVRLAYRGKWDEGTRLRLAKMSAKGHALLVTRYGVRHLSHYPRSVPEFAKLVLFPLRALAGKRQWDSFAYRRRAVVWWAFATARLGYMFRGKVPPAELGTGLEEYS